MNITNCVNTGMYESMTHWDSAIQSSIMMIGSLGCGFALGIAWAGEKKLQGHILKLENLRLGVIAEGGPDSGEALREIEEAQLKLDSALTSVTRMKYLALTIAVGTSAQLTQHFGSVGCPGFDYWAEVRNQLRHIPWPRAPRRPI